MTTTTTTAGALLHPRIRERRAAIEDLNLRTRNRKLVAAGLLVLVALIGAASTQSPLLDVDEVRVIGAVRQSPDFIRELAELNQGEPLLGLDLKAAEQRLLEHPDVAWVQATKEWNGSITVEIGERLPTARFESSEGPMVVASDGVVLEVSETVDTSLPLISGAMFSTVPGASVPVEVSEALSVAAALPGDITTLFERIEISVDMLSIRLVGGGRIDLGDARDLDTKFDAIRAFFAQVELDCLDALDVQAPSVPVITRDKSCR